MKRDDETSSYVLKKIKKMVRIDRAVRFVWYAGKTWTIASFFLMMLQGLLPLISIYLMKLIIDQVTISITMADKIAGFRQVMIFLFIAMGIAIINTFLSHVERFVKEMQAMSVTDHISSVIHSKSVEVDLEYYEDPQFYDTLHRAQEEGDYRPVKIVDDLILIGQNSISFVAMAALLFSFHYGVGIVLVLSVVPGVIAKIKYAGVMYRWTEEKTNTERKSSYFNWLLTGEAHAKEVRAFGFGEYFIKKFMAYRKMLRQEKLHVLKRQVTTEFISQTTGTVAIFCAFGIVCYQAVCGRITLGDMVMYFQAFQRGFSYLKAFLEGLSNLYEDNLFLTYFYEFLDLEPKLKEPSSPKHMPKPIKKGIAFHNVSFSYPSSGKAVLKNISLTINPNEVIALVGENGSGKTTLIKLLARLYDPSSGKITIDGTDVSEISLHKLRMDMGIIFQDFAQYYLSVKDNIGLGDINRMSDEEKVKEAAKKAGIDPVIEKLPNGYHTYLGKWFEEGEELSVGQWQRIALARAFMRDSQIIILDEPTSSLDVLSEYDVFNRFKKLCEGKTVILISHRFSTVRMADRIFVLEDGGIKEGGTHDELLLLKGKYAEMFNMQASHYK